MTDRVAPAIVAMRAWGEARDWRAYEEGAVDGASLLALADISVVAGGTMNRELPGTPTYTVFAGGLGAVDAALSEARLLRTCASRPAATHS